MTKSWTRNWMPAVSTGVALAAIFGWRLETNLTAADKHSAKSSTVSKTKDKSDESTEDHEAGSDVGADLDEDLTALVVPTEQLGKVEKSGRMQFSQALRGLLLEGVSIDGAASAKKHYEAAHRAVAGDPRAAYAYGLAYLEQKNPKEALTQFRAAAKHTSGTYLPALQASAWVQLERKEYGPALASMTDLARRVENTKDSWPTEHDRTHTAEWLGRTIGFLTGPGASPDHTAQVSDTASSIEKVLTGERKQAFDRGSKWIAKRHQELEALAARPVAEVVSEMNAKRQAARTAMQAAQAEVRRIEEEIRDVKQPFDKQIAEAAVDKRTNSQKIKTAARGIPDAQEKVDYLSVPQQMPNGVSTYRRIPVGIKFRNENAGEKKARETQLTAAQQKLQQLKTSMENAKQGMADARKQQEKAQADLRAAIAAKQPELREARHKSQEATAQLKDIEHAALSPEQIKSRVTALEAYVPLDPFTEKDRLLATLKTPGAD